MHVQKHMPMSYHKQDESKNITFCQSCFYNGDIFLLELSDYYWLQAHTVWIHRYIFLCQYARWNEEVFTEKK